MRGLSVNSKCCVVIFVYWTKTNSVERQQKGRYLKKFNKDQYK
jgi:hypothetical protein